MNPLYISAFTADFRNYGSLLDWTEGYTAAPVGVELAANWFDPDHIPRMKGYFPEFRNMPITVHGPFIEMCTRPGSAQEEAANRELEWCCRLYHEVNARSIVLHTHSHGFPRPEWEEARERIDQVLNRWVPRMQAEGMDVTVENVGYPSHDCDLYTLEQFRRLFDRLPPETGCLIDTGHAFLNRWDVTGLIHAMGTKIRGYHLNTNAGVVDDHFPIFDSRSICPRPEMEELLRTVGRVTPDAHVILEYAPRCNPTRELIFRELDGITALLADRS